MLVFDKWPGDTNRRQATVFPAGRRGLIRDSVSTPASGIFRMRRSAVSRPGTALKDRYAESNRSNLGARGKKKLPNH
jgi:hypothetical protein